MANISYKSNKEKDRAAFYFKMKLALVPIVIWAMIEILSTYFNWDVSPFGMHPHDISKWWTVFTFPFLHGDWEHLVSNSFSGYVLLATVFVFHEKNALKNVLILLISSGVLLWFLGKEGSIHIGASALIYALGYFLFVAALIVRNKNSMALSLFIVLMYGSMLWGIFPYFVPDNVSWEGHLAGAISGVVLALYQFRNFERPKEKVKIQQPFFEKHPYPPKSAWYIEDAEATDDLSN